MGDPKLLLRWEDTSILGHLMNQWHGLGAKQIAVVCAGNSVVSEELQRLGAGTESQIINPKPERGMFSSIQCAARWTGWEDGLTHFAIVLGDQPHIPEETLRKVLAVSSSVPDKICQPRQGGHRRHPVILPRGIFKELGVFDGATLKEFLARHEEVFCDLDDPALELDIDRREDYERARQMYAEKKR